MKREEKRRKDKISISCKTDANQFLVTNTLARIPFLHIIGHSLFAFTYFKQFLPFIATETFSFCFLFETYRQLGSLKWPFEKMIPLNGVSNSTLTRMPLSSHLTLRLVIEGTAARVLCLVSHININDTMI